MPFDRDAALYALLRAEARRRTEHHDDGPAKDHRPEREPEAAPSPEAAPDTPAVTPSPRPAAQSEIRSSHSPMS
ncbi:hypothetical protein [Streptomyces sp. AM 3-1-1]|uniref:hypothetical protein n=1 Tax=Streptomyces sp. AM 3-1-1 TaxID=3028711 RepID=UPI0023BA0AC7|nr:hypothetical protein [Streptomyces sp. AM 3-1-1]WEH28458.1 hypothetical protein P0D76_14545 [Streptomyces sp. AM 3-1-1]